MALNLNSGQTKVLQGIKDLMNNNATSLKIPTVMFDELSTQRDSICITTAPESQLFERVADVTGTAFRGEIHVSLTYRVMLDKSGNNDLKYIDLLEGVYQFLYNSYDTIGDETFFIGDIRQERGALLDTVYQSGVKDFNLLFVVYYERSV